MLAQRRGIMVASHHMYLSAVNPLPVMSGSGCLPAEIPNMIQGIIASDNLVDIVDDCFIHIRKVAKRTFSRFAVLQYGTVSKVSIRSEVDHCTAKIAFAISMPESTSSSG